jgi:hypothetical protein
MRFLLTVIVIAAAGYFGYNYYLEHKEEVDQKIAALMNKANPEEAPEESTQESTPAAPPKRTFESKIEMPETAPGEKKVAPPGVFYMVDRISFETDSGIRAINPGEQVKLLQRMKNGRMKVMQGTDEFEVKETQVTNDLEVALQAEKSDFVARGGRL